MTCHLLRSVIVFGACILAASLQEGPNLPPINDFHTVFLGRCEATELRSISLVTTFKMFMRGPLTRIVACDNPSKIDAAAFQALVPTVVVQSRVYDAPTEDVFSGYELPSALEQWLAVAGADIKEDFILVVPAETLFRGRFTVEDLGAFKGQPVAGPRLFLKGAASQFAKSYVQSASPYSDMLGGSSQRLADQVGGFTLIHKDDLRAILVDWRAITVAIRADHSAVEQTGELGQFDIVSKDHPTKSAFADFYGYIFACARADLRHIISPYVFSEIYASSDFDYAPRMVKYDGHRDLIFKQMDDDYLMYVSSRNPIASCRLPRSSSSFHVKSCILFRTAFSSLIIFISYLSSYRLELPPLA